MFERWIFPAAAMLLTALFYVAIWFSLWASVVFVNSTFLYSLQAPGDAILWREGAAEVPRQINAAGDYIQCQFKVSTCETVTQQYSKISNTEAP